VAEIDGTSGNGPEFRLGVDPEARSGFTLPPMINGTVAARGPTHKRGKTGVRDTCLSAFDAGRYS